MGYCVHLVLVGVRGGRGWGDGVRGGYTRLANSPDLICQMSVLLLLCCDIRSRYSTLFIYYD